MYAVIDLLTNEAIDFYVESVDLARDNAIMYSEDNATPYLVADTDDGHGVGIAFEGKWYINSETLPNA